MGASFSRAWMRFFGSSNKQHRITMLGLDGAGKSTLLHKLRFNEFTHTVPTVGFGLENISIRNIDFTVWDIGGQSRIRGLWDKFLQGSSALIFVVDSCDEKRMDSEEDSCKVELDRLLRYDDLRNASLLIYANKQDIRGALRIQEIADRLGLSKLNKRKWHIQACCALTGDGLHEGMDWLSNNVTEPV